MVLRSLINLLYSYASSYTITPKNYYDFQSVLEYLPEFTPNINDLNINKDLPIVKTIIEYLKNNYQLHLNNNKVLVSLSGGVDSMVLITIIKYLNYDVVALHINYNNREESNLEQKFIEQWCYNNNIPLYVKSITSIIRGHVKRSEYENQTRIIRYNFYKETLKTENICGIMLAHHKDDIIENIFANICRGRNYLDLAAISQSKEIDGVMIFRPMIPHFKDDIYKFAKEYNVLYFKDTTPGWSVRGKYREKLYPLLVDTFSENIKENLLKINEQSNDWNVIINNQIIDPFMKKINFYQDGCEFKIEENYISLPITFWTVIFQKIFYRYGKSSPSRKGIISFMNNIQIKKVSFISISNACVCRNVNHKIIMKF